MPLNNPAEGGAKIAMKGLAGGPNNDDIRILDLLVTPTVAMNFAIDISGYGFSSLTNVQVVAERDTTDPMSVPNVAIKSKSVNSIVVNITQGSIAVVTLLGVNVLSGPPIVPATNLQNITLHVRVEGT